MLKKELEKKWPPDSDKYKTRTMKTIAIFIISILTIGQIFAQTDKNGNPVFNSVTISEKNYSNFALISNYYTLKQNIENRNSSVYIADNPTIEQVNVAALKLNSDFFILTKDRRISVMILLKSDPNREFVIIHLSNNKTSTVPCDLKGDISENRANELINENYDSTAQIQNGVLTFNNKKYSIISNSDLEDAVKVLIKTKKLEKQKPSQKYLLTKSQIRSFILKESEVGGQLDFFTSIKGHEYDGIQIKPGLFGTKLEIALYKWGRACFDIGVNTLEDAYSIFAEFKKRDSNDREKENIKMGFNKELEK